MSCFPTSNTAASVVVTSQVVALLHEAAIFIVTATLHTCSFAAATFELATTVYDVVVDAVASIQMWLSPVPSVFLVRRPQCTSCTSLSTNVRCAAPPINVDQVPHMQGFESASGQERRAAINRTSMDERVSPPTAKLACETLGSPPVPALMLAI